MDDLMSCFNPNAFKLKVITTSQTAENFELIIAPIAEVQLSILAQIASLYAVTFATAI